ncbi:hypothetical protein B0H16DRAFT_1700508 [Mycena metata]|uniref:Uncharacterized protein n=1 Tax=Mycena metata TaxID=1033252 RepID=A0AAD7HER7_9AGAR|nr:hypothetical protein B0H16DRAFT_1700508 [Mycena metata]
MLMLNWKLTYEVLVRFEPGSYTSVKSLLPEFRIGIVSSGRRPGFEAGPSISRQRVENEAEVVNGPECKGLRADFRVDAVAKQSYTTPSALIHHWSEESRLAAIRRPPAYPDALQYPTPPSPAHIARNWQAAPLPPSPAQRDRSKSLSSASTTSASSSGRKSTGRFLGLGKDKDKERERDRQRIREAERGQPSAAELLPLHESGVGGFADELNSASSPATYRFEAVSPPSAFSGTAPPCTRSERHFSASTPPSSSSPSHGHGTNGDLTLARTPSRRGWIVHLAGSTSDLSLTSTLSTSISHAASLASSTSRKTPASPSSKSSSSKGSGGWKPSLLDKTVRYLLDGDAAPDRNTEDIRLMRVKLPGRRREDEERVAAAAAAASSSSHSSKSEHAPSAHHPHITHRPKRGGSKDITPSPSSSSSTSALSSSAPGHGADDPAALYIPDAGPWPAAFFAVF